MNQKYVYNTYIFAAIPDSNKIPTAIPMFLGSGNMTRLGRILSDVWVSGESKMAAINREFRFYHACKLRYTLFRMHFRFMVAIFDSPLTHTSDNICTSPVILPASEPWALPLEFRWARYRL